MKFRQRKRQKQNKFDLFVKSIYQTKGKEQKRCYIFDIINKNCDFYSLEQI